MEFNIADNELVAYTNRLEKMRKFDLPLAVRDTLDQMAFDVKKTELMNKFKDNFTIRAKNFLKSHSAANKSKNTFDIKQMSSDAGVIKGKSTAGDRLEAQEFGGSLQRKAIPLDAVRIGKHHDKKIKKKSYSQTLIHNIARNSMRGGQFYRDKQNTILLSRDNQRILRVEKGGNWDTLYVLNKSARIKKDPFAGAAGEASGKKVHEFYKTAFRKRVEKFYK